MNWDRFAEEHLAVLHEVVGRLRPEIEALAQAIAKSLRAGGKILVCGNGGSAADAQHIAGEFVNRFLMERRPYAAVALTTDSSALTAIGNDYAYEMIFAKQVQALGRKGDMLLAISTSGNAPNVCRAVEAANEQGLHTVALTGGRGGRLATLAQRVLCVSATAHTPRIQEGHELIYHAFCQLMEEELEGVDNG